MIDTILNIVIFVVTHVLVVCFFREDGHWNPERGKKAFRYFTCLSNVLCAISALIMAIANSGGFVPEWVWILKYIGTAAVTVTMFTVILFLAPSLGKDWLLLFKRYDLFMHLLTPLVALVSFGIFERRSMSFLQSLWGLLPVVLYGPLYLYKILYAPEGKRWDDFYGFNKSGRWLISFTAMLIGTFLICMGLMAMQNV